MKPPATGMMLAGTVPFLSFVAEHYATKDVRAKLSVYPEYADQSALPLEAAAVNARHASSVDRAQGPVDEKAAPAGRDNAPGPSSAD